MSHGEVPLDTHETCQQKSFSYVLALTYENQREATVCTCPLPLNGGKYEAGSGTTHVPNSLFPLLLGEREESLWIPMAVHIWMDVCFSGTRVSKGDLRNNGQRQKQQGGEVFLDYTETT